MDNNINNAPKGGLPRGLTMRYTLLPAYGRDYRTAAEAKTAFEAGKDFILVSHMQETYCNKEDLIAQGAIGVNIRYRNGYCLAVINL